MANPTKEEIVQNKVKPIRKHYTKTFSDGSKATASLGIDVTEVDEDGTPKEIFRFGAKFEWNVAPERSIMFEFVKWKAECCDKFSRESGMPVNPDFL